MIGILQNKNLNSNKVQNIINMHFSSVCAVVKDSQLYKMPDIDNDIQKYTAGALTFEYIVKADYINIKKIINKFGVYAGSANEEYKRLYHNFRRRFGEELIKSLELTVCPYCNRNFINSSADLDHFFPKSIYPLFSLSLFNLIPVCTVCNRKKQDNKISVSPYDITKSTDSIIKFIPLLKGTTEFSPIIKILDNEMQSNVDVLDLKDSYKIHSDLIAELYFKTIKYPKNYIKSLGKLTHSPISINMSPEEFYYGNYLKESNYYKRPLSKMTKDIIDYFKKCKKNTAHNKP